MAEAGNPDLPTTDDDRPQTAVRDGEDPIGLYTDDHGNILANNPHLEDMIRVNDQYYNQIHRLPSLDTLPSLPPDDTSLLDAPSDDGYLESDALQDMVDEKAMQRHLNDVESSFMPNESPADFKRAASSTNSFGGALPIRHVERSADTAKASTEPVESSNTEDQDASTYPPTPEDGHQDQVPKTPRLEESGVSADTTASLETMSSPTAAAAARTVSRAVAMANTKTHSDQAESEDEQSQEDIDRMEDLEYEATPRVVRVEQSVGVVAPSTIQRNIMDHFPISDAPGNTPGFALLSRRSSDKRPKYLRSRYSSSQNSSISSVVSHDGSDAGAEADYALQSGGAVPATGFSRSSSHATLSRSHSLGSMASAIGDLSNPDLARVDGNLATLTEEDLSRDRSTPRDFSPPSTPRASALNRSLPAPTDTIIAKHVRNVQVPDSVIQEYRNKHGDSALKRSTFPGSVMGKSSKGLTLKEQSSTIERLSKENFDLKLKVMFLSERLDKLSEEGVREMISENVELKTGLAKITRDNKALKKKVKELEKQLKDDEQRPSTSHSAASGEPSPKWFDEEGAQEREEELFYLRERIEEYEIQVEKLRSDALARENEKRNLAEAVRHMGERRGSAGDAREEMDVWKDLLEQETARREQSDEDNKKLREEIFKLKAEGVSSTGIPGLNHTTNIYNITKKRQVSPSRPRSRISEDVDERNGAFSAASTLQDELRRESEQLRHENSELRREVGAQTSMLTSRNREKERLYQEIEDLKLGARRGGGSVAGDSILERSASRAHVRSSSRTSTSTKITEIEREEFENKHAELRDRINALKIQNQDLQRELQSCMEDFETAVEQKKEAEGLAGELQDALEVAETDLVTMQTDRDDALRGQEESEMMFESLRKEAQEELDAFAIEAEESAAEIEHLRTELGDTTENFHALQNEMREMSEALIRLEDDHEQKTKRIQELEHELDEANHEMEQMENNLVETNGKVNRLSVQQESSQGEIAFLREEQDGDKIKIGDLEAALRGTEQSLGDERERVQELEQRLQNERHQRELIASQEKQEVQKFVNDLNREASNAQDEAYNLRQELTVKEVESAEWKQRLMELESNLREALGDLNGTRSSLLNVSDNFHSYLSFNSLTDPQSIAKLQRELENTIRDLDTTKASLTEKERIIKQRDQILESHALESRKLADMLDKERQTHRNTKHQFETYQKTQQHATRTLSQHESRVLELETTRVADKKKYAFLENTHKEQMHERNTLLLNVWGRLSALCGTDWAHNNSLINGRALPSLEAVTNMLPGFAKNLLAAVKTIETLVGDFRIRIRAVEKDLWKEYQALESHLETRTKRLERLETIHRSGIAIPGSVSSGQGEISRLRDTIRILKTEVSSLRAAAEVRDQVFTNQAPSPSVLTGPRTKMDDRSRSRTSTIRRQSTATSAIEMMDRVVKTSAGRPDDKTMGSISPNSHDDGFRPDLRWQVRLQELEYKLKAEREARKLDRSSARQRLEEKDRENAELAAQVQRERGRMREVAR